MDKFSMEIIPVKQILKKPLWAIKKYLKAN